MVSTSMRLAAVSCLLQAVCGGIFLIGGDSTDNDPLGRFSTQFLNSLDSTWERKANTSTLRVSNVAAVFEGSLCVTGGSDKPVNSQIYTRSSAVECLNSVDGSWESKANMTAPIDYHAMAVFEDELCVFGGTRVIVSPSTKVECLNSLDGTWVVKPQAELPSPRWLHKVAVFQGELCMVGGKDTSSREVSNVECLDSLDGTWTSRASLSAPVSSHAMAVFKGELCISGGKRLDAVQCLDSLGGTWRSIASLQTDRWDHEMLVINDELCVFGGMIEDFDKNATTVECLDSLDGTWVVKPQAAMTSPRYFAAAAVFPIVPIVQKVNTFWAWMQQLVSGRRLLTSAREAEIESGLVEGLPVLPEEELAIFSITDEGQAIFRVGFTITVGGDDEDEVDERIRSLQTIVDTLNFTVAGYEVVAKPAKYRPCSYSLFLRRWFWWWFAVPCGVTLEGPSTPAPTAAPTAPTNAPTPSSGTSWLSWLMLLLWG